MTQFDQDSQMQLGADGRFTGVVDGAWNIGDNPNGGYLAALALNAVRQSAPHPDIFTVTTHYLRPGTPDSPCEAVVDVVRSGRTMSNVKASLAQQGKTRLELMVTLGDLTNGTGIDVEVSQPAPDMPGPEECVARSGVAQGISLRLSERLDVRLHPDHAHRTRGDEPIIQGWIRFADRRAPDANSLPLFADAFPPSPFTMLGSVGWVPTVELTVQVLRKPVSGWIQTSFRTSALHQGRMIESGSLWDEQGNLVAQSRQLGLVMPQP